MFIPKIITTKKSQIDQMHFFPVAFPIFKRTSYDNLACIPQCAWLSIKYRNKKYKQSNKTLLAMFCMFSRKYVLRELIHADLVMKSRNRVFYEEDSCLIVFFSKIAYFLTKITRNNQNVITTCQISESKCKNNAKMHVTNFEHTVDENEIQHIYNLNILNTNTSITYVNIYFVFD